MSSVLEIFKCILCCEDEKFDDDNGSSQVMLLGISRVYYAFPNWISSPRAQLDRTTSRNQQNFVNSSLINSTRKESLPWSTPSDLRIHSRVVFPSSIGLSKGKEVERIYQEPLKPRNSSTKPNFPPPPSTSVQFLSKLTPSPSSLKPLKSASKPSSSSFINPTCITSTSFPSPGETSSTKQHLFSPNPSSTSTKPAAASINRQSSSPKLPSFSEPSSSSPSLFPSVKQTLAPSSAAVPNPQSSYPKPPSSSGPFLSSLLQSIET